MVICKENYRNVLGFIPVAGIIALILLAGFGQTATERYLQSHLSHKIIMENNKRIALYQALKERVEAYRCAFVERDYETMYQLSYFKGGAEPSLSEFRQLRDAGHSYQIQVAVRDISVNGDKARAELELILSHPDLGTNQSFHRQEWELLNDLWYKVDYGI